MTCQHLSERMDEKRRDAPVGSGGERDGFGTDTHGEDLSGVGPRYGSHRDGETAHEEVRADDNTLRDRVVIVDNPYTCE